MLAKLVGLIRLISHVIRGIFGKPTYPFNETPYILQTTSQSIEMQLWKKMGWDLNEIVEFILLLEACFNDAWPKLLDAFGASPDTRFKGDVLVWGKMLVKDGGVPTHYITGGGGVEFYTPNYRSTSAWVAALRWYVGSEVMGIRDWREIDNHPNDAKIKDIMRRWMNPTDGVNV